MAALLGRATLDAAAAFGAAPPFDEDRDIAHPAVGNTAIEAGAAIGPHAALDLVPDGTRRMRLLLALHRREFGASCKFVPAETTDYIVAT